MSMLTEGRIKVYFQIYVSMRVMIRTCSDLPDHGVDGCDQRVSLSVEDVEDVAVESGAHCPHAGQQRPELGEHVLALHVSEPSSRFALLTWR